MVAGCNHADRQAEERKGFAIQSVKGLVRISGHLQLSKENPFDEGASFIIAQLVDDPAEPVDHAAYASVRRAYHRQLGLGAAKKRVESMLLRTCAFEKPAVICHRHEKLRPTQRELAGELSEEYLRSR